MQELGKLIKKCALFEHVDADAAGSFLQQAQVMRFAKGNKIIEQGSLGEGMYIIAEGKVGVVLEISQHERAELSVLSEGDVLGEMSLLISMPRTATAIAKEDVQLYFIDASDIKQSVAQHDAQAMQMIFNLAKILAKRLHQCNEFLSTLWSERNNIDYLQQALENGQILLAKVLG